jgi:nucleoside-diphosphate-sugar epimerase
MGRAVVTGGAGFLGSHLCERLLDDGEEVLCLDNFLTGSAKNVEHLLNRPGFQLIQVDVTEYIHVPGPVDFVLHFASPASPIDYLQLPIETLKVGSIGTLHTLGVAKEKGARYLIASTSETYGDPKVHPQPESYWGHVNPVGPRGVYDEAKRFAEAMTMAYRRYHDVDTAIVRIFNSVLADEQVLYDDGECLQRTTAEDLAGILGGSVTPLRGVTVPAFGADGSVVARTADWFVGHPTEQRCFEVRTRYGRSIRVTGDHSLFVEGQTGTPTAKPVNDLSPGDRIAIASKITVPERDRVSIDLLDVLRRQKADPWRVMISWPDACEVFRANRHDLVGALHRHRGGSRQSAWGSITRWLEKGEAPLGALQASGIPVPAESTVRTASGGVRPRLPRNVEITDEFLWMLGLFVAEGTLVTNPPKSSYVSLSCDEPTLRRAEKVFERDLGLHAAWAFSDTEKRAAHFNVNSTLLTSLFVELGFGGKDKRIPGWILGLPLQRLGWFLEGYREGDGVHSGRKYDAGRMHEFSTTSDSLKDDLVVAFARFGLCPSVGRYRTNCTQRSSGCTKEHWFWRLTLSSVSPWSPLDWHRGVRQELNAKRWGDLVWAVVNEIVEIPATPLVYDFVVPDAENFWAGTGVMAHNTHGPRMRPNDGRAIPNFVRQSLRGEPITVAGDGSQTRSIQYVDDLVEGVMRLLRSGHSGPMNIGNPHEVSMLELAEAIRELCASSSEITFIPRPEDDPTIRQPDISLAKSELGWEPQVGLVEGLKKTIAYFRDHPEVLAV